MPGYFASSAFQGLCYGKLRFAWAMSRDEFPFAFLLFPLINFLLHSATDEKQFMCLPGILKQWNWKSS